MRWRVDGRHARGQALLELALILPVLLLLLLAALDLGRVFYSQISLTNAAREGAFEAAQDPTSWTPNTACDATSNRVMCAVTREVANSFISIAPNDVTLTCAGGCAKAYGNRVTVTVNGSFQLITPILWAIFGGSDLALQASATADVIDTPFVAPTPTPTATPTPTPTPTPSPSGPAPTATPSATPSPTPTCALPVAGFNFSQQNKNKPVVFTSISTPTSGTCAISFWRWDYGDSTTDAGNLPTASHMYASQGTSYQVTLTVTNPGGVSSIIRTVITK